MTTLFGHTARLTVTVGACDVDVTDALKVDDGGTVRVDTGAVLGAIRMSEAWGLGIRLDSAQPPGSFRIEAPAAPPPSEAQRRLAGAIADRARRIMRGRP